MDVAVFPDLAINLVNTTLILLRRMKNETTVVINWNYPLRLNTVSVYPSHKGNTNRQSLSDSRETRHSIKS